jgi:hypothetical protein
MGALAMPKVRGAMFVYAFRFVRESHGGAAHDRVLKRLDPRHWGTLLRPVREASWEPVEDLVAYMEAARELLAPGDASFYRRLGAFSGRLEREAAGFEPLVADPSTAVRMAPTTWRSFYDQGHVEVKTDGPLDARVRIFGFPASEALCERRVGAWASMASSATLIASAEELVCARDGSPFCEVRVNWTPAAARGGGSPPSGPETGSASRT